MDDYDTIACPKCGDEQKDMDGFGFIACVNPECGHCKHVAASRKADGKWYCDICGAPLNRAALT